MVTNFQSGCHAISLENVIPAEMVHRLKGHYHGDFAAFLGKNGAKIMTDTLIHEMRLEYQEEDIKWIV